MTTTTRENARHVCAEACYIDENSSTPDNPYRLTLYIANNGAIGLAADGNGCGNDIDVEDVDGWSDADINSKYRQLDHNVLVRNIDVPSSSISTASATCTWTSPPTWTRP